MDKQEENISDAALDERHSKSESRSRRKKSHRREESPVRGKFLYLSGLRLVLGSFVVISLIAAHEAFFFPVPIAKWKLLLVGGLFGTVSLGGLLGGIGWITKWYAEKPQRLAAKEQRELTKKRRRRRRGTELTWQRGERDQG